MNRLACPCTKPNQSLARDERGLSTVEYVIILVLIAVGAVGIWDTFGKTIVGKVTSSNGTISDMQ